MCVYVRVCVCSASVVPDFELVLKGCRIMLLFMLAGPLICPFLHLPLALGHVFYYEERTHIMGFAPFGLCPCVHNLVDFQHPRHGVHSHSHRHSGRVARILPHVFDLQECPCGVCFGWF
jgi:hypothetical protein